MWSAAPAAPVQRAARVVLPQLGDPRLPFAAILVLYVVAGSLWLGFNRGPLQIALTVGAACALDMVLHALLRRREVLVPLSAFISSLSLVLLLDYAHDPFLLFLPVFLTIGSKYLLTFRGAHVFNPSLFGIVATLVLSGGLISTAPAYQWNGTWAVSAFMVTAALTLFVFRVGRGWLVASFLIFYALQTALRAYVMRHHLPPEMLFLGTLSAPSFYLFTFFMLTDPKTSPPSRRGQIALAFAIASVDLWLHTRESVYTFFYAAFLVAAARFVWLHLRELAGRGPRYVVPATTTLRAAAVLGAVALVGGTAYAQVRPHVELTDAGFVLQEVPAARSGLGVRMDPASLQLVDPRLRHISKWLLSVGDAVAAGDVDADGRPDLLFTHPLARAGDRVALYLNRGGFRFRREPLPALAPLLADPRRQGLPSGALILDYDGDGGRDLLVLTSFGRPRLLRNLLPETGRLGFRDVSFDVGLPAHTVSVAANALDVDGDARLDLLLGNVLPPYLHGYEAPTPLNLLDLPTPAYEGDRRMLRFMHESWHDADNGGGYVLLRSSGDRFERLDPARTGMTETHWTLAIGTGDLNGDGRTDVYAANDFGPDDLYVDEGGGRFRRVSGRIFGHVGNDTYKGMNSSVADFDRDGRLDVYVSNVHHPLQAEGSLLWMNRGAGEDGTPRFRDEAAARGILNERRFGWGAGVGDLDNDGWLDVVQANGMVDDRLDRREEGCPDYWYANHKLMQSGPEIHAYADSWADLRGRCIWPNEPRRVYLNRGAGERPQFVDVARVVGLERGDNSRGVAFVDLDSDGQLDVVISNQHGSPTLLRNLPTERRSWLGVQLVGDGSRCSREAFGSQVRVLVPGERVQLREAQAANGFSAQNDTRLHFGLGASPPRLVDVAVRWCGREVRSYRLRPGRYHTLHQAR